jgi:hypothetical protein
VFSDIGFNHFYQTFLRHGTIIATWVTAIWTNFNLYPDLRFQAFALLRHQVSTKYAVFEQSLTQVHIHTERFLDSVTDELDEKTLPARHCVP